MTAEQKDFAVHFNVSRETLERLVVYEKLLRKWNPAINLVSKNTLENVWSRHIVDSAAAFEAVQPNQQKWLDMGSGGGFPGAVLAILAKEKSTETTITLVESDQRKAEFLRTVFRETEVVANVISERIEEVTSIQADAIFARALAPLSVLFEYASRHKAAKTICVFHKGHGWRKEIEDAQKEWRFSYETVTSLTKSDAVLLKIGEFERA